MRLDRALARDLRTAFASWPLRLYLLLQPAAAVVFVVRRGDELVSSVLLIWAGLAVLGFTAWWAGRHRLARPQPDPVPAARARATFALIGVAGLTLLGSGGLADLGLLPVGLGFLLSALGFGGWLWSALRSGGFTGLRERLTRDPRPFLPMLLLVGLPKLLALGPLYVVGATLALPSGLGQQVLYLVGLFGPLEAASRRPALAAVVSALAFALIHVPMVLDENAGDLVAASANVVLFQANVGLVAVLAHRRHRAVVPIGVTHALAIG